MAPKCYQDAYQARVVALKGFDSPVLTANRTRANLRRRGTRIMRSIFVVACLALAPRVQSQQPRALPKLPVFEGQAITLSPDQQAALWSGEPVVQMLNPKDGRVVAAFAIIAIKTTRKAFVAELTNVPQSLRAQGIQNFGLFKTPATSANIGPFTISASDAAALRKCHTGKCEFKLSAAEMARAKAILDSGTDGPAKLAAYAQRRGAEYVNAYRARGNAAMAVYDDFGNGGVRASDAFAALVSASSILTVNAPAVQQYLQQYPRSRPADATDAIYWTVESLKGLRPTLTINYLVVSSPPGTAGMTVAVTKQLYADHYFEGMLDERLIVDRHDLSRGDGIYLMVLRQYRFDNLPGGVLNIRGRAKSALHDRLDAELRRAEAAAH